MIQAELSERLKTEGQDRVASHNPDFVELMRSEARAIADRSGTVTIDDLRAFASRTGIEPRHRNAWGSIFHERGWNIVGYIKSERPESHARRIAVWARMDRM